MHILTLNSVTNLTTQVKSYNQTHQVSYASIPFLATTLLGPVVLLLHDGLFVLMTATRLHVHVILTVLPSCLSLSWLILLLQWTFFLWLLRRAVTSEYFLVYFHIWWIPFTLGWEFSGDSDGLKKKIHLQCRRPRFDPWVGKISWRRKWQPTPVFLPGEFHWQRTLAGYTPWGSQRVGHDWATNT